MTHRSKRELERSLEDLSEESGGGPSGRIVIRETTIPTAWSESDGDPAETAETVIDL